MSDPVAITPRFRRSVRIDTDFASATAIDGFHCPASFQAAVTFMAAHVADTDKAHLRGPDLMVAASLVWPLRSPVFLAHPSHSGTSRFFVW